MKLMQGLCVRRVLINSTQTFAQLKVEGEITVQLEDCTRKLEELAGQMQDKTASTAGESWPDNDSNVFKRCVSSE